MPLNLQIRGWRHGLNAIHAALALPAARRAWLGATVAMLACLLFGMDDPGVRLSVSMQGNTTGTGEVFYTSQGRGYTQDRSVAFPLQAGGRPQAHVIVLRPGEAITRIRFDPGRSPGRVTVSRVELQDAGRHRQTYAGAKLRAAIGLQHQLQVRGLDDTGVHMLSNGRDPYFDIALEQPLLPSTPLSRSRILLVAGLLGFLAWLALDLAANRLAAWLGRSRLARDMDRWGATLSDEAVLVVDARILAVVAALLVLGTTYVALALNQSSVGIWETMYPDQPVRQMVDLGSPKRIRSDEWSVQTPWILNQVRRGEPLHNPNIGGESAPLLATLPADTVAAWPELKFAGFRFLDLDRGFSWLWAYKTFGLLAAFFWLCLVLTRGSLGASVLGSIWVYVSSYTQWWFSSGLPEILIAFALGVVGAIYALHAKRRAWMAVGCAVMVYAAINLVLTLYPPFIIPLAYLGVAIVAGFSLRQGALREVFRAPRLLLLAAGCALVGAYVVLFTTTAMPAIDAMRATVYPGQRVSTSGGVPLEQMLYGFLEAFRLGERHFPALSYNASEASSFVLLAPLVLLVVPLRSLFRREGALLLALCGACLLALAWVAIRLPPVIERPLQVAGWSLVTPKRAILALGVGSILACVVLCATIRQSRLAARGLEARQMGIVAVVVFVMTLGWGLHRTDPVFFTWQVLAMGTVASGLLAAGIALGRLAVLATGIALFALPTMATNPLTSGLSALVSKPILVQAAGYARRPGDRWAVIGDKHLAQGLKAQGLDVFAGSQFLPDRRALSVLDPTGRYAGIWNRYATVALRSQPDAASPIFRLLHGDQYEISLDVCGGALRSIGVTLLAYASPVPAADLACLHELDAPSDSGVRLFRLE